MDTSHLTALVDLIAYNVKTVIQESQSIGKPIPPLDSTLPGPFDSPEESTLELMQAVQTIQGACEQLCASVTSPAHTMVKRAMAFEDTACIQVALSARISEFLLDRPEGLHVSELSKMSSIEEGKLARTLRLLSVRHCYREVKPDVFTNNRLSLKLLPDDSVSALMGHFANEAFQGASRLYDTLSDPECGLSYSSDKTAFVRVHGCHPFQFFAEHPEASERFNRAMIGWKTAAEGIPLPRLYPWSNVAADSTLCDVGGGIGHASLVVVKAFPQLKVVLQDLPHVLDDAKQLWHKVVAKNIGDDRRIQFVPIDFFKSQPVKDCQIYYMSHILHDWPDADCVAILRNVASSMNRNSKLLIHEIILGAASRKVNGAAHTADRAPAPLLPNYGAGRTLLYSQDINMMVLVNGKERTLQEIIDLGEKAGLKFLNLYDAAESGLIELDLK